MPIFKKIFKIAAKIILGLFLFYLFLSWIVIPIGATWAIKAQGTKQLRHPVKVKVVLFNPFLWRLSINKLQILDDNKQLMAGFEKLKVDVSFLSLFKKTYRVESV